MIRINLLPVEMRRERRLQAKLLVVAMASAVSVTAALGWLGMKWFGDLKAAEDRLAAADAKLGELQRRVAYVDQLEANKNDYTVRVQSIRDIGNSRRVWSQFLDDLIDVVNNDGNAERHLAWFDDVVVRNDPTKGALVKLTCAVQGDEQDRLANFHDDMAGSKFGQMAVLSDPTWKLEEEEGRVPPTSLRFALSLQFPPTTAKSQPGSPAAK
jgi:Tfp pilus assembly protein PilN